MLDDEACWRGSSKYMGLERNPIVIDQYQYMYLGVDLDLNGIRESVMTRLGRHFH